MLKGLKMKKGIAEANRRQVCSQMWKMLMMMMKKKNSKKKSKN